MNTCISVLNFFANRKRLCEKRSDAVITTVRGIIDITLYIKYFANKLCVQADFKNVQKAALIRLGFPV